MRKTSFLGVAVASLALWAASIGHAQPYSNAVMALNPSAYWPLHETTQPPFGYYVATNRGSAGALANGYYQTWYQPSGTTFYPTNYIQRTPGPIADGDAGMLCLYDKGPGQYVVFPRYTNGVANPAVTLQPPFTIEAWVYSGNTNRGLLPIVNEGRNAVQGDASATPPYTNTFRGFSLGQYKNYFYFQLYKAIRNDNNGVPELSAKFVTTNVWYHVVATYDGTTAYLYTNGVQAATATAGYVPDLVSPLLIGTGTEISSGGAVTYDGGIDDVAIYPTALSLGQIQAHYAAASTTSYATTVLGDSPSIYLRLDEPPMTSYPSSSTYPVANNFGSLGAAANGLYQPGTAPGVAGPPFAGFGSSSRAVAINGFFGGVDVGGGSLPPDLNPTNRQPFTITTWFQGNPADAPARFQEIIGHSDSSWRLAMGGGTGNNNNNPADIHFNPGPGPELQFANLADVLTNNFRFNDGNWHMAAGVCDGTTEFLYLDGVLAKTNTLAGNITGSSLDVIIGGDPQYMVPSANSAKLRPFNGQVAQVAFFTNALSQAQIQQLFGAAGVPLTIVKQPQSTTNNAGANVALSVEVRGSAPAYQWYKNNSLLSGATTASLTFNPAVLSDAGSYYAVIANAAGVVTSAVAQVTIYGPPVVISQSPTDVKVFAGASPMLRVAVTGPQPYSYQWSRNGSPISNATSSSYVLPASAGSSTYSCAVTNAFGSVSLNPITVSVLPAPAAPYPVAVLNDTPLAYFRLNEQLPNPYGTDGQTAYDYAGGLNATFTNIWTGQPGYDALFWPQTDPADTAAGFGGASTVDSFVGNTPGYLNFATSNGLSAAFSVEAWVNGGYGQTTGAGIVSLGYGNGGEQFNLDTGATGSKYRFFVRTAADPANAKAVNGTNAPNDNVWHHVVGVCDQANGRLYLYVDGVQTATATIPANTGLINPTSPLSIGSRQSAKGSAYDAQFVGSIDEVALYGYALSPSQVLAHYTAAGVPPLIVQQPPSAITTNAGATVVIPATVIGTAPISYQWFKDYVTPIPGQTGPTLTLVNVQESATYSLKAYNAYNSAGVDSQLASVSVIAGPPYLDADLQPLSSTNYAGTPFTYSVSVSGSAPFRYQWYSNQVAILGATNSTYNFTTSLGTNFYYVAVTNSAGYVLSSTATNVGVGVTALSPADYSYKMKIALSGYNRGETLADFPILVKLGTNLPGFSYQQLASAAGGDLRFADATGTRQIPHEIDEWNPDGISLVWVQVPRLLGTNNPASTNNFIWAYWGNPAATAPLAWSTNGAVWVPQSWEGLPAYQVVYHLKESALPFADSTLQCPANNGRAPTPATGIVGTAGAFTGTAWLDAGTVNLGDVLTLSAWVNVDAAASSQQTIWANQKGGYGEPGFALFVNTYNHADQLLDLASGGTGGNEATSGANSLTFGQWHLASVAINRTNGTAQFFVDGVGVAQSTSIVKDFANLGDLNLGRLTNSGAYFHGLMDEARIRQTTSSTDWIWAEYMTVAQNATFQSYAPISSSLVTITCQVVNGTLVLSWPQGTLQVADQVSGPYTDLTTATSPHNVQLAPGTPRFYRVKVR